MKSISILLALLGLIISSAFASSIWSNDVCIANGINNVAGITRECASLVVPRNLDNDSYGNSTVFGYRLLTSMEPKGQLWLVSGEPNLANTFADELITAAGTDFDIYVINTRGTGLSSPVYCPTTFSNMSPENYDDWSACYNEVLQDTEMTSDLINLNAVQMANTLKLFIDNSQDRSTRVFMMGLSRMGTYITNTYMVRYANALTGVILDGTVAGGFSSYLSAFDLEREKVILDYVAGCAKDTFCLAYLGADPVQFTRNTFSSLVESHCKEVVEEFGSLEDMSRVMSYVLFPNPETRPVITAMISRLNRCNPADITVLKAIAHMTRPKLHTMAKMNLTATLPDTNAFVRQHMELSEMARRVLPPADMQEMISKSVFRVYNHDVMISKLVNDLPWLLAQPDPLWGFVPAVDVPVLMVSGKYDAETPVYIAEDVAEKLKNVKQIIVPNGGHLNIPGDFSCGGSMVQRFVRSGSLDDAKSGEECYNQYKSTYKAPEFEIELKAHLASMLPSDNDSLLTSFSLYGQLPSTTVGLIVGILILGVVVIGGVVTLVVLIKKGVITVKRPFKKMQDEEISA